MQVMVFLAALSALSGFEVVQEWDFQDQGALSAWQPNAHLTDVEHRDGALHARAIDWDPFFVCSGLELPATASQCVLVRLKADAAGTGQLYWTRHTAGRHGGFSSEKVTNFSVSASEIYQDIYIVPYWHHEKVIRQLRLDVYDGARFAIAYIAVLERQDATPVSHVRAWEAATGAPDDWLSLNNDRLLVSPPLQLPAAPIGWASLLLQSPVDTAITLDWSTHAMLGANSETVYARGDDNPRIYHVELHGHRQWEGLLAGLSIRVPAGADVNVRRISLAPEPDGPPEPAVRYFGFENGVNRAGRSESVLAQFTNLGGGEARLDQVRLETTPGLRVRGEVCCQGGPTIRNGEIMELRWRVTAEHPGAYPIVLRWSDTEPLQEAELVFSPAISLSAYYVPPPRPIETTHDILAYYFPGWDADAKWECIRHGAPIRKPLLGYYDEANPECVDWQIKWAVENGIRCFLVDWYWVDGAQSLLHWFEAYREARYRDLLDVAIMWANHNPPGSHSREDWRRVTQEWIDNYFTLDTYYHINGKPAIFLWDATILRNDLGGSAAVAEAFAESQEMARAAGHDGIEFIVLQHQVNAGDIAQWIREGYAGNTSYHEWGDAVDLAPAPSLGRYADIAATAPEAWVRRRKLSGTLAYYPVVDTGWDSRPWHGANARAFHGRSVPLFSELLASARAYCEAHDQSIVILGPLNEWGEGSYIEPNLEFGFGMYEAIREVFGIQPTEGWPVNVSHRDVGLGPYDFPPPPRTFSWSFDEDSEGWAAMMNITDFQAGDGLLCFTSISADPALVVSTRGLNAADYPRLHLRMKVTGPMPEAARAQLFWAIGDRAVTEAASLHFPLAAAGEFHDYVLDLDAHPRWRGRISMLRFDPCEFSDARICIDRIAFENAGGAARDETMRP